MSAAPDRSWTLLEALKPAADFLATAGVDNARLNAELLLAHVLGMTRLDLYLQYERALSTADRTRFRELLRRRRDRVPLQHLLGGVEFFSLPFKIRPGVFIPRPETEVLLERALERLALVFPAPAEGSSPELAAPVSTPSAAPVSPSSAEPPGGRGASSWRALELGVGSGVIATVLAARRPDLRVWASDISTEALALAQENARLNGVEDRIAFEERAGLPLGDGELAQLIISNPPYVRPDELADLAPEVAEHDPHAALFGGEDGLDFYRLLAEQSPSRLAPNGLLAVEIGAEQGDAVQKIFRAAGFSDSELSQDLAGRDRVVIASFTP